MRALIQCVSEASIRIEGQQGGSIGRGFVIFLGVGLGDTEAQAQCLWSKISKMRIFEDEEGRMNRSLTDAGGAILAVSQFTLYGDTRGQRRPGFTRAFTR